jgi:hypothetical protein
MFGEETRYPSATSSDGTATRIGPSSSGRAGDVWSKLQAVASGLRADSNVLKGDWTPKRFVILEFPTIERARAWWGSPEYAEAKALRQSIATARMVLAEGLPAGVPQPT